MRAVRSFGESVMGSGRVGALMATTVTLEWAKGEEMWLYSFYNVEDPSAERVGLQTSDHFRNHYRIWTRATPSESLTNAFMVSHSDLTFGEVFQWIGLEIVEKFEKIRSLSAFLRNYPTEFEHHSVGMLIDIMSLYGKSPAQLPHVLFQMDQIALNTPKDNADEHLLTRAEMAAYQQKLALKLHHFLSQKDLGPQPDGIQVTISATSRLNGVLPRVDLAWTAPLVGMIRQKERLVPNNPNEPRHFLPLRDFTCLLAPEGPPQLLAPTSPPCEIADILRDLPIVERSVDSPNPDRWSPSQTYFSDAESSSSRSSPIPWFWHDPNEERDGEEEEELLDMPNVEAAQNANDVFTQMEVWREPDPIHPNWAQRLFGSG